MQTIYEPKGRAKEYGELALNLYQGCSHGCFYCYAPQMLHMSREEFLNPQPKQGIIEELKKVAPEYADKKVFLCFTCDPYQHIDEKFQLTRQTLKIFAQNKISPIILTKGGLRSTRDFDILSNCNGKYGATLTYLDPALSQLEEPVAASPQERIEALKQAHENKIYTWVSLEPVIDPDESLKIIHSTLDFVNEYKIGVLNYDERAKKIDYIQFAKKALRILQQHDKKHYIKYDLLKYFFARG